MDWYHPQLGLISSWTPFTLNDIQYPADWLIRSTNDERKELGFFPVRVDPRPDDRFYFVSQNAPLIRDDHAVVTWNATPRDLGELKAREVAAIKATAGALLAPSDWKVIRASEGVKPLDAATATYRSAVRAASNEAEQSIVLCASIDDLTALPPVSWPEIA